MSERRWTDWKWQMRNRIRSLDELRDHVRLTQDEIDAVEQTKEHFRWSITPYYASLMDPEDPLCPVRRQVVPALDELEEDVVGVVDPLEEVAHSPVRNLIHNYTDRVAFCITAECAIYCRYCLRKRIVGDADAFLRRNEIQQGIDYIAAHSEVRDVLLTGGDPLTFSDGNVGWILGRLRAIPHVEIVRIGSRMPVKLPQRITTELCGILAAHHPIWLNTHFNHPKELTGEASAAAARLADAGVPLGNQTVLLRGVNDDVETMRRLCEGLVRMRVRPYYLYQAQVIGGTRHLRTPIEVGMAIMESLQGRTTGFAIPRYVLDTPYGKVPLTRDYILGRSGEHVVMRTTRGRLWAEPNAAPEASMNAVTLPQIEMPADAATISPDAPRFVHVPE